MAPRTAVDRTRTGQIHVAEFRCFPPSDPFSREPSRGLRGSVPIPSFLALDLVIVATSILVSNSPGSGSSPSPETDEAGTLRKRRAEDRNLPGFHAHGARWPAARITLQEGRSGRLPPLHRPNPESRSEGPHVRHPLRREPVGGVVPAPVGAVRRRRVGGCRPGCLIGVIGPGSPCGGRARDAAALRPGRAGRPRGGEAAGNPPRSLAADLPVS